MDDNTQRVAIEQEIQDLSCLQKGVRKASRGVGRIVLLCVWVAFVVMVFTVMQPFWALLASLYAGGFMLFCVSGFFSTDPTKDEIENQDG